MRRWKAVWIAGVAVCVLTFAATSSEALRRSSVACGGGGRIVNHGTLTLSDCTISGNSGYQGGGVENYGTLTLNNVTISNNSASGAGGGLYNDRGTVYLTNVTIRGNSATFGGNGLDNRYGTVYLANVAISGNNRGDNYDGAIFNQGFICFGSVSSCTASPLQPRGGNSLITGNSGRGIANDNGVVAVSDSTIDGNSGGGLVNGSGAIVLERVTISGNHSSGHGGGIDNEGHHGGSVDGTNVTISGNSADTFGGGIYDGDARTTIVNSTISDNSAGSRGGGVAAGGYAGGEVELKATLLARNGVNCSGPNIVSDGWNLDTGSSCGFRGPGDQSNVGDANVELAALAANGGPSQGSSDQHAPMRTAALLAGSPAVDAVAAASGCPPAPASDERGISRPQGSACDVGAFELPPPTITGNVRCTAAVTPPRGSTITGSVIVPPAATCKLADVIVRRDVLVEAGATLDDVGSAIGHDLVGKAPAGIGVRSALSQARVGHDLRITAIGGAGPEGGDSFVCDTAVGHDLTITKGDDDAKSFVIGDGPDCTGGKVSVGHDLRATHNENTVDVAGAEVVHDLVVEKNRPAGATVHGNHVGHDARCRGNDPFAGSGNSAGHSNSCG